MDAKKILIVSRSFYPTNSPRSFRTTELVKEFARQGHDVTLLTLKNDEYHLPFEEEWGVEIKDFGPLRFPKISNMNNGNFIKKSAWKVQRLLGILFEYPDIEIAYRVKRALCHEDGYDLLISVAVPHPIHWGVALARNRKHHIAGTWVADCGDPYMGFDRDKISKPFYFKYVEKMFCKRADFISVPIEGARRAYYPEFRDKIRVIPQGFKFEDIELNGYGKHSNGVPTFGYAGNLLGGGRNPYELLDFLINIDQQFKFIIYTKKEGLLQKYIDKAEGKIEVRDYIPRKQLLNELSSMDFLVNLENATNTQTPSKLIDYYLTRRPVLSVPSANLNTEFITQFLNGNYSDRLHFNNMDRYRIENVCRQFLKLCR